MSYLSSLERWFSRSSVRVAGVAVVLAATGLVASGATAATSPQSEKLVLNYSCAFPSGIRTMSAQVAATFPATGTTGQPIQPTGAEVSVTLPPSVVAYLHGLSASSLMVSAAVKTQVTEGGTSATALWQRFISPVTALPAQGSLGATTSGAVPSVTLKAAGKATFRILNLLLLLRPYRAPGQATHPSSLLVGCTLQAGQNATLATVPVAGATSLSQQEAAIAVGSQPAGSNASAITGTTWTVSPGGSTSGSASKVTLKDVSTRAPVTCASSSASGTLKSGTGLPGSKIGSFGTVTFQGCSGPSHQAFTLTTSALPWFLNVDTYDATALVTGGTMTGIHAVLSGPGCSATLDGTGATANDGTVRLAYSFSTFTLQTLATGGNLHFYNVNGCSGLLHSGDAAALTAGYVITPQQTITNVCSPLPRKDFKLNPRFPVPQPPPPPPGEHPEHFAEPGCAYIAGFSNVNKLNEAALIGPGLTQLTLGITTIDYCYPNNCSKVNYFQVDAAGKLEYQGKPQFPPATATLLAFGFMPVTATLQLTELGTVNAIGVGKAISSPPICKHDCQTRFTVSSRVNLQISNVKVNGTPLDVGPHCGTAHPFDIVLHGISPQYTINTGGVLTGTVTVPPFSGCGVGEDLNSIFTAPVSGPGNIVKLTQAPPCIIPGGGFGCPPAKPVPVH